MPTNINGNTGIDKVQDGTVVNADIDTLDASKLTGSIAAARIANNTIDSAHIASGAVDDAHLATGITASKLTGALPAISAANLTNVPKDVTVGGRKNLIINGDMVVNQRGGTATINGTGVTYNVDRWLGRGVSSAGVFTLVQSASSCPDFRKALAATVTTADSSIASGSSYRIQHFIEAQNMMHLNWGNSNAKSITLSFWVLSTGPTGTFGGSIANGNYDRFNPFSYSISAANTYEKKTITISGDTSGTWPTDNTLGMRINFSLGAGSSKVGTAGTWTSSSYEGVTGQTNLIATNGAALYITGVQVEQGSTATDFEHRSFGEELALCKRYFESSYPHGTVVGVTSFVTGYLTRAVSGNTNSEIGGPSYTVEKRAIPTVVIYHAVNGATNRVYKVSDGSSQTITGLAQHNVHGGGYLQLSTGADNSYKYHFSADAEL